MILFIFTLYLEAYAIGYRTSVEEKKKKSHNDKQAHKWRLYTDTCTGTSHVWLIKCVSGVQSNHFAIYFWFQLQFDFFFINTMPKYCIETSGYSILMGSEAVRQLIRLVSPVLQLIFHKRNHLFSSSFFSCYLDLFCCWFFFSFIVYHRTTKFHLIHIHRTERIVNSMNSNCVSPFSTPVEKSANFCSFGNNCSMFCIQASSKHRCTCAFVCGIWRLLN